MNTDFMGGPGLNALDMLSHETLLTTALFSQYFSDEETEACKDKELVQGHPTSAQQGQDSNPPNQLKPHSV
jgi:hypothetical protein